MREEREFQFLLVEDNPDDEALTSRAIRAERPRSQILTARTATEARQWLEHAARSQESVDLVLLDLRLPPSGGLDFLRELRAATGVTPMPVIVFGSSLQGQTIIEAYRQGASAVIEKPVHPTDYMDRVRAAIAFFCGVAAIPERDAIGNHVGCASVR